MEYLHVYASLDGDEQLGSVVAQFYLMRLIREGELPSGNSAYYGEVSAQTLSFAAIVVSTIPIVCIYPFISKHFSKGIMLGSIKG